ncbi:MAG: hypothetical protein IPK39_24245 [Sulfuritalea sp.]|nr:hypothetical protein [Sulfuritalea sp.]
MSATLDAPLAPCGAKAGFREACFAPPQPAGCAKPAALRPGLRLLWLRAVHTLRLNPLAFPRNRCHLLAKHYQDGALASGYRNNPPKDAELALSLFRDQQSRPAATQRARRRQ